MAREIGRDFKQFGTVTAVSFPAVTHVADDIILCFVSDPQDHIFLDPTTTGSFALIGASGGTGAGAGVAAYWIRAAGAGTTMPTITGMTSGDHITATVIIRGCPTGVDPFYTGADLIISASGTPLAEVESIFGSITTDDADVLQIACHTTDDWSGAYFAPQTDAGTDSPVNHTSGARTGGNGAGMLIGSRAYPTAATVTDNFCVHSFSSKQVAWMAIAFKSTDSGIAFYNPSPPVTYLSPLSYGGTYPTDAASGSNDDSTRIGSTFSVGGQSYAYKASGQGGASPLGQKDAQQYYTNNSGTYSGKVGGGTWEHDVQSASGKLIAVHFATPFYGGMSPAITGSGGFYVGFRSDEAGADSYKIWQGLGTNTDPISPIGPGVVVIDPTDTSHVHAVGTFDITKIDAVFVGVYRDVAESKIDFSIGAILEPVILAGGYSAAPVTSGDFVQSLEDYECLTVLKLGEGQYQSYHDLTIGNGSSDEVYFIDDGDSMTFPTVGANFIAPANSITYKYDIGSTSTCTHINGSIGGGSEQNLVFDINASATFSVAGRVFTNLAVTFTTINAGDLTGAVFRGCTTIPAGNAMADITVDASKDTEAFIIAGANQTALQTAIDLLGDFTLSNNTTALRINFTGTGDVTLVGPAGLIFSGNTTDLEYSSVNASTLTITPGTGTTISTTAIDDAAVAVVVDSSTAITLIGQFDDASALTSGVRYRIYNNTQANELYNDVVGGSGLSISTTIGVGLDIVAGDSLTFTGTYQSGTTYYEEMQATITANTTSNIFNVVKTNWAAIEDHSLDGSSQDGVKFNDQTGTNRIDVLTDWTFAQFVSWWGYIITTELGIRLWFGALTMIDNANARINNATADILLDNAGTTEYYQTASGRIYRADGARPVANPTSGGGGLDPQWLLNVLAITTGSGMTAPQEAKIDDILADTADIQPNYAAATNLATVDTVVDAIKLITDALPDSGALNDLATILADTADMQPKVDEVHIRNDLNGSKVNTYDDAGASIANSDFTLTNTDQGDGTFTVVKT